MSRGLPRVSDKYRNPAFNAYQHSLLGPNNLQAPTSSLLAFWAQGQNIPPSLAGKASANETAQPAATVGV